MRRRDCPPDFAARELPPAMQTFPMTEDRQRMAQSGWRRRTSHPAARPQRTEPPMIEYTSKARAGASMLLIWWLL